MSVCLFVFWHKKLRANFHKMSGNSWETLWFAKARFELVLLTYIPGLYTDLAFVYISL